MDRERTTRHRSSAADSLAAKPWEARTLGSILGVVRVIRDAKLQARRQNYMGHGEARPLLRDPRLPCRETRRRSDREGRKHRTNCRVDRSGSRPRPGTKRTGRRPPPFQHQQNHRARDTRLCPGMNGHVRIAGLAGCLMCVACTLGMRASTCAPPRPQIGSSYSPRYSILLLTHRTLG